MTVLGWPQGAQLDQATTTSLSGVPTALTDAVGVGSSGLSSEESWPVQQLWLHATPGAFRARADAVAGALHESLMMVPRRLSAGPLGCATSWNVNEFLRDGQPDRAWRLAARLMLAARANHLQGFEGQVADDLAISALLLAGEVHGCAFGLLEAACVIGRVSEAAAVGVLVYAALPPASGLLTQALLVRRLIVLDLAARRMAVDGVSAESSEALMCRAPSVEVGQAPPPNAMR